MSDNARDSKGRTGTTQDGVPNYGIAQDFPILWQMAQEYDFAERLGGCNSNLHAEVDQALRELWMSRQATLVKAVEE